MVRCVGVHRAAIRLPGPCWEEHAEGAGIPSNRYCDFQEVPTRGRKAARVPRRDLQPLQQHELRFARVEYLEPERGYHHDCGRSKVRAARDEVCLVGRDSSMRLFVVAMAACLWVGAVWAVTQAAPQNTAPPATIDYQ